MQSVTISSFTESLASALRLPVSAIPKFDSNPTIGHQQLNKWLRQFNLALLSVPGPISSWLLNSGVSGLTHISQGATGRAGEMHHTCLYEDEVLTFDPHFDDAGLKHVNYNSMLVALDPGRFAHSIARPRTKAHWVHQCAMTYIDRSHISYEKAEALATAAVSWEEVEHEDDVAKYASPASVALNDMAEWQHD